MEERLANRDADLVSFNQTQQTDLFNPASNPEEFNQVFNFYKSLQTTELEEVVEGGEGEFAKFGSVGMGLGTGAGSFNMNLVNQLTEQVASVAVEDRPVVTSEAKPDVATLEEKSVSHKAEIKAIFEHPEALKYENQLDDSEKPVLPDGE